MKVNTTLLVAFGFVQSAVFAGTASAQNQFADERCQTDQNGQECFDNGCAQIGGECKSQQAQLPPQGTEDQGETQQGCICDSPFEPQSQCTVVHDDQTGESQCADLGCPPIQDYNCDPDSCTCGEPQDFGDGLCQPNQQNPQECQDLGCSDQGGKCEPTQAQEPHLPGDTQNGIGGCHCQLPDNPQGQKHCEVLFEHPDQTPICLDLGCGSMVDYDCEFEPDLGICDCICDSIVPTDALLLLFTSKVDFDWVGPGTFCANVFNVYRQDSQYLPDIFPPVAVADDYGFCLYSGLLVSHAMDLMVPPTSVVQHYLVTAESPAGESLMGFASLPFPRPNTSPCPSPPPLP